MHSTKRLITIIVVITVIVTVLYFGFKNLYPSASNSLNSARTPAPIPVITATAQQKNIPVFVRSIGTVISPHSVEVRSQIDGNLIELLVREGQTVSRGDLLARIDNRAIQAVIAQQRAELANRQAQLDVATLDLKRYEQLQAQNAISRQVLDQQQATVNQLKQSLLAQKSSINEQEVKLSYTRIQSPIAGVVGIVNIHQGNYVRAGDTQSLFSIVQVAPISIEVALPQHLLPQLLPLAHSGTLSAVPMQAFSNDGKQNLGTGHLTLIDNQISASTGTVRVRATFDNAAMTLWPGQSVSTQIELRQIEGAIVVPQSAIRQGNQYTYVWRVHNNKVESVTVTVLENSIGQVAVKGLNAGDEVVIDGASRLKPDALIQRIEAPPPAEESALQPIATLRQGSNSNALSPT